MIEAEAKLWLSANLDVPRETLERLEQFAQLLRESATTQNLVAASTIESVWTRHIVDSAQLVPMASQTGRWIDLGSGAGFPGIVAAVLRSGPTTLVESRRKRVEFLRTAIEILQITAATVAHARAETLPESEFATISARAFAPLGLTLTIGSRFAGPTTRWLLPRGRSAQAELDAARKTWQGDFRIHQSITDPDSAIIVAERVSPRKLR